MSERMTNMEIEDVLSSIRRLVSEDSALKTRRNDLPESGPAANRLVLTPDFRVIADRAANSAPSEPPRALADEMDDGGGRATADESGAAEPQSEGAAVTRSAPTGSIDPAARDDALEGDVTASSHQAAECADTTDTAAARPSAPGDHGDEDAPGTGPGDAERPAAIADAGIADAGTFDIAASAAGKTDSADAVRRVLFSAEATPPRTADWFDRAVDGEEIEEDLTRAVQEALAPARATLGDSPAGATGGADAARAAEGAANAAQAPDAAQVSGGIDDNASADRAWDAATALLRDRIARLEAAVAEPAAEDAAVDAQAGTQTAEDREERPVMSSPPRGAGAGAAHAAGGQADGHAPPESSERASFRSARQAPGPGREDGQARSAADDVRTIERPADTPVPEAGPADSARLGAEAAVAAGAEVAGAAGTDAAPRAGLSDPLLAEPMPAGDAHVRDGTHGGDANPDDAGFIDEETLYEIVRQILREELQGTLGERITRNVRKMVRAEINRALAARRMDED